MNTSLQIHSYNDPSHCNGRRLDIGFTLIEVLFATAAFAVVLLVMKMTFSGAMGLRNKAHRLTEWDNRVNIALNIIKKDFEGLTMHTTYAPELLINPLGQSSSGNSQVSFYTTSGNVNDYYPWGDIQKVFYSLEQAQGILPTTETTNQMGRSLIRSLQRDISLDPTIEQIEQGTELLLLEGVESVNYEFFDGVTWTPSWDSNTSDPVMPEAVRITLLIYSEDLNLNQQGLVTRDILVPVYVTGPEIDDSEEEAEDPGEGGNAPLSNI